MSISVPWLRATTFVAFVVALAIAAVGQEENFASRPNVAPEGTIVLIQLSGRLDTHGARAGDPFQARLAEPLVAPNGVTLEAGRKIKGHVSAVELGLRRRLLLSFDEIETSSGWEPFFATVTGVPGEHGTNQVSEEGEIVRKAMTKQQIAEAVVVAAGEGAEEGMRSGGKKGAAAGAGNGAADAALTAFESSHELVLEKGTALEVRLDRNLMIPAR